MNHIISLELNHPYFTNGRLDFTELIPSKESLALIKRYNLILKNVNGKYDLLSFQNISRSDFITTMATVYNDKPLEFILDYSGPNLIKISDFPVNWCGHISISSGSKSYDENGRSDLKIEFKENSLANSSYVGKIRFNWSDLNTDTNEFVLNFPIRKTIWRYFVINRSNLKLINPEIRDGKGFAFNYSGIVQLPNGENSLLFESGKQAYSIQEKSDIRLSLIDKINSNRSDDSKKMNTENKVIINSLPRPNAESLNLNNENDAEYQYSDSYVYI